MTTYTFENDVLCMENDCIRRVIHFENSVPVQSILQNKATGTEWATDGKSPVFFLQGADIAGAVLSPLADGVQFETPLCTVRWQFVLPDGLPFVESTLSVRGTWQDAPETGGSHAATGQEYTGKKNKITCSYADSFGSSSESLTLCAVELRDVTDTTNTLVRTVAGDLHPKESSGYDGQIFFVTDRLCTEDCIAVKLSPCRAAQYSRSSEDFITAGTGSMRIASPGLDSRAVSPDEWVCAYSCAFGLCRSKEREPLVRRWYARVMPQRTPYIMSNTWGDRSQDKCICEEFMLREIDRAAEIGVDIVQIDDGWEQGITANSALQKGGVWTGGYRNSDPDFWAVNRKKFPHGLAPVVEYARRRGVAVGLWFSPDALNDYENYELDVATLFDFYKTCGIRHFKLDGIMVPNRRAEKNIVQMLHLLTEKSRGDIVFNMDITAGKRLGYLFHREYGDLFVENRYTDWKNYYPHSTLRNLWQLAHYIPARRLQFEVLNLRRNAALYRSLLAPANYEIDYAFASVMAAQPLIWMEMSGLPAEDVRRLQKITAACKAVRDDFTDVEPIGEAPTGFSLTGFKIYGRQHDYLILLRENTTRSTLPGLPALQDILATNDPNAGKNPPALTLPRSYLFGIIR